MTNESLTGGIMVVVVAGAIAAWQFIGEFLSYRLWLERVCEGCFSIDDPDFDEPANNTQEILILKVGDECPCCQRGVLCAQPILVLEPMKNGDEGTPDSSTKNLLACGYCGFINQ